MMHRRTCITGRIMSKRSGGKGLVFYDIHADGVKVQIFADARNFTAFQGEKGLEGFMKLMNESKVPDAFLPFACTMRTECYRWTCARHR